MCDHDLAIRNSVSIIVAIAINPADPAAGLNKWAHSDAHARNNFVMPFQMAADMEGHSGKAETASYLAEQATRAVKGQELDSLISHYAQMVANSPELQRD